MMDAEAQVARRPLSVVEDDVKLVKCVCVCVEDRVKWKQVIGCGSDGRLKDEEDVE